MRAVRNLALFLCAWASASGCDSTPIESSSVAPGESTGPTQTGDDTVDLQIQTYRDGELLCYSLTTRSGSEVANGCPVDQGTNDGAAFGGSGPVGDSWFAVVWVADGVQVGETSAPFLRSADGWVVLESRESGFFWLEFENLGARFRCSVEFASLDCAMTQAPPSSAG